MNSQSNIIKMIRYCVVVILLVVSFPTRSLIQQVSAQTIVTPITITWSSKAGNQGTKSVTVGGTVKWLWGDNFRHDVVSSNPDFVNSPIKTGLGSFYEFNFTKAGSYPYHCSLHKTTMVGTIEVLGATVTASAVPSFKPSSSSPSQRNSASPQFTATTSVIPSFKPSSSSPSQKKSAQSNNKPTIKPSLISTQSTVTASAVPSIKPSLSSAPQKKTASFSKIPSKIKSNPQANDAPVKAAQPLEGSKTTVSN